MGFVDREPFYFIRGVRLSKNTGGLPASGTRRGCEAVKQPRGECGNAAQRQAFKTLTHHRLPHGADSLLCNSVGPVPRNFAGWLL